MKIFVNFFEKNVKFLQFFDSQMAIFRRVRMGNQKILYLKLIVEIDKGLVLTNL